VKRITVFTLCFGLFGTVWIFPQALALFYQVRGGEILHQIIVSLDLSPAAFACETSTALNDHQGHQLQVAENYLIRARRINPRLSQTELLLGRASCLRHQYKKAESHFNRYIELRPTNPLGYLERGFALLAECHNNIADEPVERASGCPDDRLQAQIADSWKAGGFEPSRFIGYAQDNFDNQAFAEAVRWFRFAEWSGAVDSSLLPMPEFFKWAIAASLSENPLPASASSRLPVYPLQSMLLIEAEQLRWLKTLDKYSLDYGDHPEIQTIDQAVLGRMAWSGRTGGLIQVVESGDFLVETRAYDAPPAPTKLHLEMDFSPVDSFTLPNGDRRFLSSTVRLSIATGIHLITIHYVNDAVVEGVDRNALIDWVRFERVK
jgi:tetratricopeptide (TPR) repeat protein